MARVAAILKITATAVWRERRSLLSVTTNNFFGTIAFFFFFGHFSNHTVGIIFYLLLGTLMLFPLSADPVQKIPPERLALWPLSRLEHWFIRVLAPWFNPITWLFCALVLWSAFDRDVKTAGISAVLMVAILMLISLVPPGGRSNVWRVVPRFPGTLGQLVRKDLRQILSTLDFWLAGFLSCAFLLYRLLAGDVPTEAKTVFSLLVVLALSSVAQTFFALDGLQGLIRYQVLPVRGWQVLVAKALAWLTIVLVLTAPLSSRVGLSAALAVLPFGCWATVSHRNSQRRWRFASCPTLWSSVAVVVALLSTGVAVFRISIWWAIPAVVASLISIVISGRHFDRHPSIR
ncbi:MAG TPA: hypothetical protein VJP02_24945 [Candidatus Sulfotelmatobacter sp.]|nr:hypothetical protein [Candidatus Sulfotelmatobacter sp.]